MMGSSGEFIQKNPLNSCGVCRLCQALWTKSMRLEEMQRCLCILERGMPS